MRPTIIILILCVPLQSENTFISHITNDVRQELYTMTITQQRHLLTIYHDIGTKIIHQQQEDNWGRLLVQHISAHLKKEIPSHAHEFTQRNLNHMILFATTYTPADIIAKRLDHLTWAHNIVLATLVTNEQARDFYIEKTISEGWTLAVLWDKISSSHHTHKTQK